MYLCTYTGKYTYRHGLAKFAHVPMRPCRRLTGAHISKSFERAADETWSGPESVVAHRTAEKQKTESDRDKRKQLPSGGGGRR